MAAPLKDGASRRRSTKPRVALTGRQHDAAKLAATGKTTEEIADEMQLARPTVKHHLDAARRKLGVKYKRELHDRLEQVHIVIKEGTE